MEEFRFSPDRDCQRVSRVFFRKAAQEKTRICPNCGQAYELGRATSAVTSFKPRKGLIYR